VLASGLPALSTCADHAKIPNVRNWAVRDYGNRVGIWRIMEVLTRYGIRASAALNSEICDHHPELIEEAGRRGWELIGRAWPRPGTRLITWPKPVSGTSATGSTTISRIYSRSRR
jgi:hypothetical protein